MNGTSAVPAESPWWPLGHTLETTDARICLSKESMLSHSDRRKDSLDWFLLGSLEQFYSVRSVIPVIICKIGSKRCHVRVIKQMVSIFLQMGIVLLAG